MRLFAEGTVAASRRWRSTTNCGTRFGATSRRSPTPRPARLYRALLRGEAESDPPEPELRQQAARASRGRPAESARHNLPIALTSFIGRDRELRELARLLDRNRLVTLTGAGGSGKTRLGPGGCDGAGERMSGRGLACGAGGPWRPDAGAGGDGLRGRAHPPVPATSPSKASIAQLVPVARAADPRQLRASDRGLRRPGRASPGAPARGCASSPRAGNRFAFRGRSPGGCRRWRFPSPTSLQLEWGRRLRVGPAVLRAGERRRAGFTLGEDNALAVAEICSRLDGMPLALELAAARVGALSPAQIAERLGDSLAVLTAGSRSALDRQQTLGPR